MNSSPGVRRDVVGGERLSFHCGDLPMLGWAGGCPKVGHQHRPGFCCIRRCCFMEDRLLYKQNKDTRKAQDIMNNVNKLYAALVLITRPGVRDVAVLALTNHGSRKLAGVGR